MLWLPFASWISQDNPSEKDLNQGTLVIFNLEPSVSNEELRQIFGAYGEVKEVSSFFIIFAYLLIVNLCPSNVSKFMWILLC